jgi:diadenosine tetraphosphate (Ap4A) HIT family hydrolase
VIRRTVRQRAVKKIASKQQPDGCDLCDELAGDNCLSAFLRLYQSSESKLLAETNSLGLIADISPIVPGHLLIVTKEHFLSFGQASDLVWDELDDIKRAAREILTKYYEPPFFFEHGSASDFSSNGSCISHAHIHVIPAATNILPHLSQVSPHPLCMIPVDMKSIVPRNPCDYLYYENKGGMGCIIVSPKIPLPRQFIRMSVAKEAGIPEWDWQISFTHRVSRLTNRVRLDGNENSAGLYNDY